MEQIMDLIVKIAALLLFLGIGYAGKHLIAFVKSKMSASDAEKLDQFIAELVAAAEQLYSKKDPDGTIRLEYVQTMLIEKGYEITDAVRAMIEAKVYDINITNKAVSLKAGENNG